MNRPPIFLGGAGRSGTTLLRVILDSHPHVACGPELKVTPVVCRLWHDFQTAYYPALEQYLLDPIHLNRMFAQLILSLMEQYRQQSGKPRVAEKSPNNVFFFQHLHFLFPDSPLIQIIRDGRDVVCSLLTMNWADAKTGRPLAYTRNARQAAEYWASAVRAGRMAAQQSPALGRRYLEVRYEELVTQPVPTLHRLFGFIDEPWDPGVLRFHEHKRNLAGESSADQVAKALYTSSAGRWQRDLKLQDREVLKEVAGDLLIELGYARDRDW